MIEKYLIEKWSYGRATRADRRDFESKQAEQPDSKYNWPVCMKARLRHSV